MDERVQEINNNLEIMKKYLDKCVKDEDWHGVMDAAADIRELVAELSAYEKMRE